MKSRRVSCILKVSTSAISQKKKMFCNTRVNVTRSRFGRRHTLWRMFLFFTTFTTTKSTEVIDSQSRALYERPPWTTTWILLPGRLARQAARRRSRRWAIPRWLLTGWAQWEVRWSGGVERLVWEADWITRCVGRWGVDTEQVIKFTKLW